MKNKSWLYIAILTLILAITWLAISAFSYFRKSTVPSDAVQASSPLDPTIDMTLINKLQERANK